MHERSETMGTIRRWLHTLVCLAVGVIWFFATMLAVIIWGIGTSEYIGFSPGLVIIGVVVTLVAVGAGVYGWARCGRRWP